MSYLDMTLNHLIVNLQSWSHGECVLPFHCHNSHVHLDQQILVSVRVSYKDQRERFNHLTACKQITNVILNW